MRANLVLLLAAGSGIAVPHTMVARSGHLYKTAEILKTEGVTPTTSHSDGVTIIPIGDLPTGLEEQIGYVPKAERGNAEAQGANERAEIGALVAGSRSDAENVKTDDSALPTKRTAGSFYGMKREDLMKIMGGPADVILREGFGSDGTMAVVGTIWYYSGKKGEETWFAVDNKDIVIGGLYKGARITKPGK